MKSKVLTPIFLSLALVTGICIGLLFSFPDRHLTFAEGDPREEKVKQIINYIDFEYLDAVNTDSILDIAITDLLRKLDPHSSYIPSSDVASASENIQGSFDGIGIEFKLYRDTLTVIRAIEGGPSEEAGIKAGDRILNANDETLYGEGIQVQDITSRLKGEPGSKVVLQIFDPYKKELQALTVKRGKVPINSIQSSFMINSNTGLIKLLRFAGTTSKEIKVAIAGLKAQGMKRLVLDLRDNPGGLLQAAQAVSDQFLENGKLIVFTRDRNEEGDEIYASRKGEFQEGDLIVLINEGSASASEIVAGAMQDNDRGLILGRRSFGKGLVQEEITLRDGSKIRLTTQRYYTPSGRSIQKPYGDYDRGYLERKGYGTQVPQQDSSSIAPQEYRTLAGRSVFGGGGIKPDIEVPFDTSKAATLVYHLGMVVSFDEKAFEYVDANRPKLIQLKRDEFMRDFEADSVVMAHFFTSRIEYLSEISESAKALLQSRVKAYIAYNLYGSSGFQEAFSLSDPVIQKALDLFERGYVLSPADTL